MKARTDEDRRVGFADPAGRDAHHQPGHLVFAGFEAPAVEPEERQRGGQRGALVAVHERMVLREVEEIGGGHLGD